LDKIKIYAHRCAMLDGPENNISTAIMALARGADGFECDILLTKDGHPVAAHDDNLSRISNGHITKKISEMKLEDAIKISLPGGVKINHLRDFLAVAEGSAEKIIFIEIKKINSSNRLIEAVLKEIKAHPSANVIIISFDENILMNFFVKNPNLRVKIGFIIGKISQLMNLEQFLINYDCVLMGWDSERFWTKMLFKIAFNCLAVKKQLKNLDLDRIYTGIASNKKDLEWFKKRGFTKIFSDTMAVIS